MGLVHQAPTILFGDTDHRNWWIHANSNRLYMLADRDGSGGAEAPHPLELYADPNSANDFARFSNQVRATQYCDVNGANCLTPGSGTGSTVTPVNCPAGQVLTGIAANGSPVCTNQVSTCTMGGKAFTTGAVCRTGCEIVSIGISVSNIVSVATCEPDGSWRPYRRAETCISYTSCTSF